MWRDNSVRGRNRLIPPLPPPGGAGIGIFSTGGVVEVVSPRVQECLSKAGSGGAALPPGC